jgi:hypothetical protein
MHQVDSLKEAVLSHEHILSRSACGNKWILALPTMLRGHQAELEGMLHKVFGKNIASDHNLALARQLSLNWCASKAKKLKQIASEARVN